MSSIGPIKPPGPKLLKGLSKTGQANLSEPAGKSNVPGVAVETFQAVTPHLAVQTNPTSTLNNSAKINPVQLAAMKQVGEQTALNTAAAGVGGPTSAAPSLWSKLKALGKSIISGDFALRRAAEKAVAEVNKLEPATSELSDLELKAKTQEFKSRLAVGESLDDLLPEAFAVVRESSRRVLGIRPYDVQVEGGFYAHRGGIVEMKTGEGKTYMGMLPVYLNALKGDGVHVLTYNDYLAGRDAQKANQVLGALDVSVGFIHDQMSPQERVAANQADVTYGSASEFGFQYLQDNLVNRIEDKAGRDQSKVFALVDEADSVLLDESRTPLIISDTAQQDERPTALFKEVVQHLKPGVDYDTEPSKKQAWLTESGLTNVEKILGMGELYTQKNQHLLPYLNAALHVKAILQEDVDYMVKDGQVMLIDELTGRAKPDHRFSEGIHQAIEAAAGMQVGMSSKTVASITHPNYLRKYGKVAGMTGTALAAKEDFQSLGLGVIGVPTNKPNIRVDRQDRLFGDNKTRDKALLAEVQSLKEQGKPVLVGTLSIEHSEALSQKLQQLGIPHQVLNARNPAAEAQIVAQAGRKGAVTIATNMAGRGTDIKLGGDPKGLAAWESQSTGIPTESLLPKWEAHCKREQEEVLKSGGLTVLGAGRNESRRIDEQLAGRAGRQGAPGSSQFFLSAQDVLFRRNLEEPLSLSQEISGDMAEAWTNKAQTRSEGRNRDARTQLLQYDIAANLQREAIYADRTSVLTGADLRQELPGLVQRTATAIADVHFEGSFLKDPMRLKQHASALTQTPLDRVPDFEKPRHLSKWLNEKISSKLEQRESAFGSDTFANTLKPLYLAATDMAWSDQQETLQNLREGSWMQSFAEKDPVQEYNLQAYRRFEKMLDGVAVNFVSMALQVPTPAEAEAQLRATGQK